MLVLMSPFTWELPWAGEQDQDVFPELASISLLSEHLTIECSHTMFDTNQDNKYISQQISFVWRFTGTASDATLNYENFSNLLPSNRCS
jgi:hypothetical protein